jgi:hypothetical protein
MRRKTIALAVCLIAPGCRGQTPPPVRYLDCPAIFAEMQANNAELQALEAGGWLGQYGVSTNVGVGPVRFGMGSEATPEQQATAIDSRQRYLALFAGIRHCVPPQPASQAAP